MKATELMISDWVYWNGDIPVKMDRKDFHVPMENELDLIENLRPIPLTQKILKANGFERNVLCAGDYYMIPEEEMVDILFHVNEDSYEDGYHVSPLIDHNDNSYVLFDMCYVHELQHALRLCDKNDLADNFKIKKD